MNLSLFPEAAEPVQTAAAAKRAHRLGMYDTPTWATESLLRRDFSDLDRHSWVIDPTAGSGNWLLSLPSHVRATGVEIDADRAELARRRTGREIIQGDFLDVALPAAHPTAFIGNPPFAVGLIDRILDRAYHLLPDGGRVGFIVPGFYFRKRITVLGERWSMRQALLPPDLYPRLRFSIFWLVLTRSRARTLVGFALFDEQAAILGLHRRVRKVLTEGRGWRGVVEEALAALGGEADLQELYPEVVKRRISSNPFIEEKVRQVARQHLVRVRRGRYALPSHARPRGGGGTASPGPRARGHAAAAGRGAGRPC